MQTRMVYCVIAGVSLSLSLAGCGDPHQSSANTKANPPTPALPSTRVTFSDLPVPPKPPVTPEFVQHGKTVYAQNCVACHGVNGDGKGDAAGFLLPRPRDFVAANYRLRSTPTGRLPTDVDLFRSVSLGMPGTPMPGWKHILSENDRWAVVEYLKTLSPRFGDSDEDRTAVVSLGTPPVRDAVAVAKGKELYTQLACLSCHGETGRGDGASAVSLVDDSNTRIRARDFSKPNTFKSGYSTKDIVRSLLTGFNGTPMVGFHGAVSEEDAWKVAYYVESFAKAPAPPAIARKSQGFLGREVVGEPDVRIRLTERAWKFDPEVIRVKQGQIVEITFEPTDNGLGAGHGFAVSSYDEDVFLNGAMVGTPKTVKFRADRAGKFTYYCSTQCSTEKLHPLMNGTLIVEETSPKRTASIQ